MTGAPYFTPELFDFLRQLKRRNKRDWFTRNKPRYEQAIRNPALLFIAAVTPGLAKLSRKLPAAALRGSLFRIYRDVRFSSDKRPYKTHIGMQWTYAKSKDAHSPCYYLHFEPDGCFVAAVDLSERQICSPKFIPDLLAACRTMTPLVEFTWQALAQKAQAAEVAL